VSESFSAKVEELREAVRRRRAILFVGGGASVGLGLPSWQGLIAHIGEELGPDVEGFAQPGSNYLTLAEYYRIKKGAIGPLRSWMDVQWSAGDEEIRNSRLHHLIIELDFPLIYTTNYDRNIERAYELAGKAFAKIVDVRDLPEVDLEATQIVKFHGDFDDDASIVLTETDYYDRLSFESPLDLKLRADALARPILFIGYSLSDINIRLLLHKLWRTWDASGHPQNRPKSFIFMHQPDPVQEAVLGQWDIEVVSNEADDPGTALCEFLESLK